MAESATGADLIHPRDERMAQSVGTLRTALTTDGYTAGELSSMTKNDMVYADDLNLGHNSVKDRQDRGSPPYNICYTAEEVSGVEGSLLPAGCVRPASIAAMNAAATAVTADPATAWDEDSFVLIKGDVSTYWNSTTWIAGVAPA